MNRRALRLFVTPQPAVLRFGTPDPRARRALVEFLVRAMDRSESRP